MVKEKTYKFEFTEAELQAKAMLIDSAVHNWLDYAFTHGHPNYNSPSTGYITEISMRKQIAETWQFELFGIVPEKPAPTPAPNAETVAVPTEDKGHGIIYNVVTAPVTVPIGIVGAIGHGLKKGLGAVAHGLKLVPPEEKPAEATEESKSQ
jgi:hypothetical protein